MLTAERYLTLYDRYNGDGKVEEFYEATVDELSDLLFCTPRNAKLVLRKLEEERLIRWSPGVGRGNRSRIAFLSDKETFLLDTSRSLVERGDYKHSFELVDRFSEGTGAKEKFLDWLNGHFGYEKIERDGMIPRDILRFPVFQSVLTLDPAEVNYGFDSHVIRQIFGRLVQFDESQKKIVGGIAHDWKSSPDAMEWVFYLRKGVLFHNGRELTSADVVYTCDRLRSGKPNSWVLRGLKEVEAVGPWVVRFKLTAPNRIFDRFLCTSAISILPKDLGGQSEEAFWMLPVGSGPFRLLSYTPNGITLGAHAGYYAGRPYLDGVRIVTVPENCQDALNELPEVMQSKDKEQDVIEALSTEEEGQRLAQLCEGCVLVIWNLNRQGPQQSEAFRRAVRMILNSDDLVKELGSERMLAATSFRPEVSMASPVGSLDPDRIRAALRESRYDGSVLRLRTRDRFGKDAQWIVNRLAEWGIPTEIIVSSFKESIDGGDSLGDADFAINRIIFVEDEVCEIELYEHGNCIVSSYLDPERLAQIRSRIDDSLKAETIRDRRLALRQIEDRLRDEAAIMFLYHQSVNRFLHPSVRGASLNSLGWIDFKDIWLENLT